MTAGDSANVEVVGRFLDGFARRDADAMVQLMTDDMLFEPAPTPLRPYSAYHGHDGMRRYLADLSATWERLEVTAIEYREAGDYVLVFGRIYAAGRGSVQDDPATFVWRLQDGLVVWGKVFRNREEALESVGLAD
ncbi:MAG: nuclear transport factor 2 family protein [Thermoleophilaceae bacterium]